MHYSPGLIVHIFCGIVAVVAGLLALLVRKGSALHRSTGKIFSVAMLVMASSGVVLAVIKGQRFNVIVGILTCYLVATAWMTTVRREKTVGRTETLFLFVALATGVGSLVFFWLAARTSVRIGSAAAFVIFAVIAFLSAAGDLRMIARGGLSGAPRLVRHIWRMGLSLLVAVGSFFLGTAGDPVMRRSGLRATLFPHEIRATHLPEIPVWIVVIVTLVWLFRVRFASVYRKLSVARR